MASWKISLMKSILSSALLVLSVSAMAQQTSRVSDCSTLKYKRHRSAWLCGKAIVCSGDICGRPSTYDFDDVFYVLLRDNQGNVLETKSLSYEKPNFCFDGRGNGDYQLAFVLYTKGVPEAARVFPTRYKHNTEKPNDVIYMIEARCPKVQQ
jgi:hypothetical protein